MLFYEARATDDSSKAAFLAKLAKGGNVEDAAFNENALQQ